MKLEDQVVSFDLAKRLKELGMKQDSYFAWWWRRNNTNLLTEALLKETVNYIRYSAFTVAELGHMLPPGYHSVKVSGGREWMVYLYEDEVKHYEYSQLAATEADARALMLIYLLENKLLTLPK